MQTTDQSGTQGFPLNPLQTVLTTSLAQEAHALVRQLGSVLALRPSDHVLLIPGDVGMTGLTLVQSFGCHVTMLTNTDFAVEPNDDRLVIERGMLSALPFATASFDAVIVASPVTTHLLQTARELARVLRYAGRLGMVALSPYRDQLAADASAAQAPVLMQTRPAAVYRAILGEAGFTAFLTEDRRRAVRQSAATVYREHMLRSEPEDTALSLLASGGLNVTLITAEKAL